MSVISCKIRTEASSMIAVKFNHCECECGSKEEPSHADGSVVLVGTFCGKEIYMKP
jgi:hypothetical protein